MRFASVAARALPLARALCPHTVCVSFKRKFIWSLVCVVGQSRVLSPIWMLVCEAVGPVLICRNCLWSKFAARLLSSCACLLQFQRTYTVTLGWKSWNKLHLTSFPGSPARVLLRLSFELWVSSIAFKTRFPNFFSIPFRCLHAILFAAANVFFDLAPKDAINLVGNCRSTEMSWPKLTIKSTEEPRGFSK